MSAHRFCNNDISEEEKEVLQSLPDFETREMAIHDAMERVKTLHKPIVCKRKKMTNVWYVCSKNNCSFKISLSYSRLSGRWSYSRFVKHSCRGISIPNCLDYRRSMLSTVHDEVVSSLSLSKRFKRMTSIRLTKFQLRSFFRRRNAARERLRLLAYAKLSNYLDKLRELNPGTVTDLQRYSGLYFQSCFVCPSTSVHAFQHCAPLIFLDACHCKPPERNQIFVASCQDGNMQNFVLAIGVYRSETEDSWTSFLFNLRSALHLDLHPSLSIMSDRCKGLHAAVASVLPNAPHSFCAFHLKNNLQRQKFGCEDCGVVMRLAACWSEAEYDRIIQAVEPPDASGYLSTIDPASYCLYAFPGHRFGRVASSAAESVNAWLKSKDENLRALSPLYLIDRLLSRLNKNFLERRNIHGDSTEIFSPYLLTQIETNMSTGGTCFYEIVSEDKYEVELAPGKPDYVIVDMNARSCGCLSFQDKGLPCKHAMSVLADIADDAWEAFVHPCYHVHSLMQVYSQYINLPCVAGIVTSTLLPPPQFVNRPGRPNTLRIPSSGEDTSGRKVSKMKKKKNFKTLVSTETVDGDSVPVLVGEISNTRVLRRYHCDHCKEPGHNRRTCPRLVSPHVDEANDANNDDDSSNRALSVERELGALDESHVSSQVEPDCVVNSSSVEEVVGIELNDTVTPDIVGGTPESSAPLNGGTSNEVEENARSNERSIPSNDDQLRVLPSRKRQLPARFRQD